MYVLVAKKEAERILSLMKEISYYNQSAGGQAGQAFLLYLGLKEEPKNYIFFIMTTNAPNALILI